MVFLKRNWSRLALLIWALPTGICLSLLMGQHFVAPVKESLRGLSSEHGLIVHHFLSLQCTCSKNLIKHLLGRRSMNGYREIVHLIHSDAKVSMQLRDAGFEVEPIAEEAAVSKYSLHALPQLVVVNSGKTLYQGGYGRDQQHSQIYADESIIRAAADQRVVAEYPLFGCANGKLRKSTLDLLGVKYGFGQ